MALFICHKKNPWIKQGDIYELFEDGFQKCKVGEDGKILGNEGLVLPESDILPYVMRMLNKGLDKPGLRRKPKHDYLNDIDIEEWDYAKT